MKKISYILIVMFLSIILIGCSHEHKFEENFIEPTCQGEGYTIYTCECGYGYRDNYTPAIGHSFGEWVVIKDSTETELGLKEKICQKCQEKVTEAISKKEHVHKYEEEITAPTCLEQGYTEFTCSCGENYKANYVLPTGHSYGEWVVTTQPTETSKGVKEKICKNCNDKVLETIPLLNHTHKYEEKIVEATCEQQGYTEYRCSCGESYKDNYIDAKGHSYGEWTKIKDATETEYGLEQRECSVCSHIDTQLIPLLSHTHKFSEKIIMPTCVEKGYTEFTCLCGETYKDKYVDAKGHSYGEWVIIREATETQYGIKERKCQECDNVDAQVIPLLTHVHKYQETKIEETCTQKGYTEFKCSCGDSYIENETNALGHKYGEWIVKKEATETEYGVKERKCNVWNYF